MATIEKQINGDWFEIREAARGVPSLFDCFKLDSAMLSDHIEKLNHAVEQGIIEYKRSSLAPVFLSLETMKYKTLDMADLEAQRHDIDAVLLAVLVQRLMAQGIVHLASDRKQDEGRRLGSGLEINSIISVIREQVLVDPKMKQHPAVKKIIMQINLYSREHQKMKGMIANIRPENRATFLTNYKQRIGAIFASIKSNFAALEIEGAQDHTSILKQIPLKDLVPFFTAQARQLSIVRSTFTFACEEKYKTRELLVGLYNRRGSTLRMLENEVAEYRQACQKASLSSTEECERTVSNAFKDEVVALFERKL